MSAAIIDGELVVEKKKPILAKERGRPVICVFDPVAAHAVVLDRALAGLRDKVDILWQAGFSRTFIDMGDIDERTSPALIAAKKPVLLVSELEVIAGNCRSGLEVMDNLRARLVNIPLMVISSNGCLTRVHDKFGKELKGLNVGWFFAWECLENEPGEQKRLFSVVAEISG